MIIELEYRKVKMKFDIDYSILDNEIYIEKEMSYVEIKNEKIALSDFNFMIGLEKKLIKKIRVKNENSF